MDNEIKILSPCGMLGYGFPKESFMRGMEEMPHAIVVDAGSTDAGPHKLGAGVAIVSRRVAKMDLELLISKGLENKIPIIVGSAGGAGAKVHVEWTLDIIEEILKEKGFKAKIAVIWADFSQDEIVQALKEGRITPLGTGVKPLVEEKVYETANIVSQMGTGFLGNVEKCRMGFHHLPCCYHEDKRIFIRSCPHRWSQQPSADGIYNFP